MLKLITAAAAPTRRARPARWRPKVALGFVLALVTVGALATPAHADDYPSWQDVQNAKSNQAAADAEVTRINGLIANLQVQVQQTQAAAQQRGAELQVAEQKYFAADRKATSLQTQADTAKSDADSATTQAGRLAAQLYRAGDGNLTASLLLSGDKTQKADRLLSDLGSMSKLVESTSGIYKKAVTAQNNATSLSQQAATARTERQKLRDEADKAYVAAQAAASAAQEQLATQQQQIVVLQAQAAALQDKTTQVVAAYQQGVEERARAAAAAAATPSGAGLPGGYVGSQGWAVPVDGPITDGFGSRDAPCSGCTSYHEGADIGAGCGAIIHAAHDGVVSYTGWYGGYGNFVSIDHGGVGTAYGHIVSGGILVSPGQRVVAGEAIARVGSTGNSTGCHLHFEVRDGGARGTPINPIAFMAAHGAPLG